MSESLTRIFKCQDVKMSKCQKQKMFGKMSRCQDVKMQAGHLMLRRIDKMSRCQDVKMYVKLN